MSMSALKELALRGFPAYTDTDKTTLYTERNAVEVTSGELTCVNFLIYL